MSNYPQIHVIAKYQEFLKKLTGVGKPDSVDLSYVKKLGFKSSYDEKILPAIKFIGLVEDKRGGAPTELWGDLRTNMGQALFSGLKSGYRDLFAFYPDAHLRDEEALANFFRGNSDADSEGVSRMVNAFIAVRDLSEPDEVSEQEAVENSNLPRNDKSQANSDKSQEGPDGSGAIVHSVASGPNGKGTVNLNIQLQLPSDASGEIYDKFFAAMKKHGLI